jgi:hypothetical protein
MTRNLASNIWGLVLFGLIVAGVYWGVIPSGMSSAADAVQITNYSWDRSGFDTIMMLNFSVRNDHDYAVKDIVIRCTHRAKSGTMIDENTRTLYQQIPAHGSVSQYNFNMGFIHSQVDRSTCKVTSYLRA